MWRRRHLYGLDVFEDESDMNARNVGCNTKTPSRIPGDSNLQLHVCENRNSNSHLTLTSGCQMTLPLIFQNLFPFLCVSCVLWPSYPCRVNHVDNIIIIIIINENSRSFRRRLPMFSISLLHSPHVSPNSPLRTLAVLTSRLSQYSTQNPLCPHLTSLPTFHSQP